MGFLTNESRVKSFLMKFFLLLPLLSALFFLWISHSLCSASMNSSTTGSAVHFDYSLHGPHGPLHWGDLRPDWVNCKAGKQQSPVDIKNVEPHRLPSHKLHEGLQVRYAISRQETSASIQRPQHMSAAVLWKNGGGILRINGTVYYLLQWHWHHPSEHKLLGRRYPLEMHMVHQSLDNKIAAVSVLYQYGKQNQFIAEITSQLQWMLRNNETHLDVKQLKADHSSLGRHYYRYEGSSTAPPCTEGIIWTVVKKRWEVRREQVKALMDSAMGNNARPVQKLNGRTIFYH